MLTNELQRFPLRVKIYDKIAELVRDGTFPVGSQLPSEPDLSEALGVSRTVLREALVLLEEDGLIVLRRGIGRFVAKQRPTAGLKRLLPMEMLLSTASDLPVEVHRVRTVLEEPSDFTRQQLNLDSDDQVTFWESVIRAGGEPLCLTQEWCAKPSTLDQMHPQLSRRITEAAASPMTMMAALLGQQGLRQLSAVAAVSATVIGEERAEMLPVAADTPLLQLRQLVVSHSNVPLLLAKHLLAPGIPPLMVTQLA